MSYAEQLKRLVEIISDERFKKVMEHPDFEDAFGAYNDDEQPFREKDVSDQVLAVWILEAQGDLHVGEDGRIWCEPYMGEPMVWSDGEWLTEDEEDDEDDGDTCEGDLDDDEEEDEDE